MYLKIWQILKKFRKACEHQRYILCVWRYLENQINFYENCFIFVCKCLQLFEFQTMSMNVRASCVNMSMRCVLCGAKYSKDLLHGPQWEGGENRGRSKHNPELIYSTADSAWSRGPWIWRIMLPHSARCSKSVHPCPWIIFVQSSAKSW